MSGFSEELLKKMASDRGGKTLHEALGDACKYKIMQKNFGAILRHGYVMQDGVMLPRNAKQIDDLVNRVFSGELS